MNWEPITHIFLGTLPLLVMVASLLGVVVWNLIEVKSGFAQIRAELLQIRGEISLIRSDIASIRERVAKLEERDQHPHLVQP